MNSGTNTQDHSYQDWLQIDSKNSIQWEINGNFSGDYDFVNRITYYRENFKR